MSNPKPLEMNLKPCRHGVKGLCCACAYGERSWYQSKKGMIVERDCVDFIKYNRTMERNNNE